MYGHRPFAERFFPDNYFPQGADYSGVSPLVVHTLLMTYQTEIVLRMSYDNTITLRMACDCQE